MGYLRHEITLPPVNYKSPADLTATYTSAVTITLSSLTGFTISNSAQIKYIVVIPVSGAATVYFNFLDGVKIIESSNVLTISGNGISTPFVTGDVYEVGINDQAKGYDPSTQTWKFSNYTPEWEHYTDAESWVTQSALYDSYQDLGSEIDVRTYTRLGAYLVGSASNCQNVDLKILGKHESAGSYEYEIEAVKRLWNLSGSGDDYRYYYEYDVGTIPYIQFQFKSADTGSSTGSLSMHIDKKWRN